MTAPSVPAGESTRSDEATLVALNEEFQRAVMARDLATLDRVLADDFILYASSGGDQALTKAQVIDDTRRMNFDENASSDVRARVWGDTGVVTARLAMKGTTDGTPFEATVRFTDTVRAHAIGLETGLCARVAGPGRKQTLVSVPQPAGVGDSGGPPCSTVDYATEAASYTAAFDALRADPLVDPARVYVFGAIYGSADFVTDESDHQRIVDIVNGVHPGNGRLVVVPGMDHYLTPAASQRASLARVRQRGSAPYDRRFSTVLLDWLCRLESCAA